MDPERMRAIDRWLGVPLCALLTGLDRLGVGPAAPSAVAPGAVRRILVIKLAEMGALVHAHPALARARELWPGAEVHMLVFAENAAAVEFMELVPPANVHRLRGGGAAELALDAARVLRRLRALRFDLVLDLEFFARAGAALAWLSGARARIGFDRHTMEGLYKGHLYTHPIPLNPHLHTASAYVAMVDTVAGGGDGAPWGKVVTCAPESLPLPRFEPTPAQTASVVEVLRAAGASLEKGTRLVVLNCNSSALIPMRRWPADRFVELGRRLLDRPDVRIVLTGVEDERAEVAEIAAAIGERRVVDLAGRTSLPELATLYTLASLLVTNDSGPAHFASLTDLPTLVLFGPETPELFGPLGPGKVSLRAGLACSPCVSAYNHRRVRCQDNLCMQAITVDEVEATARELLDATPGRRPLAAVLGARGEVP